MTTKPPSRKRLELLWRSAFASLHAGSFGENRSIRIVSTRRQMVWKQHRFSHEGAQKVRCWNCERILGRKEFTVDHILKVKHGGGDELENLRPSCEPCNAGRERK